jgi:hypothetical protein
MKKQFVKVVAATLIESPLAGIHTTYARGIQPMDNQETILDFVVKFLAERELQGAIHQRGDTVSVIPECDQSAGQRSITYHFTQFEADDLGFQAKDLTKEELDRDLKQLRRYIKWRS